MTCSDTKHVFSVIMGNLYIIIIIIIITLQMIAEVQSLNSNITGI